ncbi:MAG: DUF262 domain-containing protein [Verrucomicrobiia bacterium]
MSENNEDQIPKPTLLAQAEELLWRKAPRQVRTKMSDEEIEAKYSSKEERIVTEMNREKLPNFVEALKRPGYMSLRPTYQRRRRWGAERQSRLIESFIMNIPVPPVFVYETSYNRYEVMDGQQRITAIKDFYEDQLVLTGLERWPELNEKKRKQLPSKLQAAIDRRSISVVVLLTESATTDEDALLLKELVFERLNTGGVRLSQQEVRNCIYQSKLNELLLELGKLPTFRKTWDLPSYSETELSAPSDELLDNRFYSTMQDLEVILRFFALRHYTHYQRGMQGFLDLYMLRAQCFGDADIAFLRKQFTDTLNLGAEIFGEKLFRPFDKTNHEWEKKPHVAFSDAVMVGLSAYLDQSKQLVHKQQDVVVGTMNLFQAHEDGTFTGRGNSKKDVENRINLFKGLLATVLR